MPFEKNNKLGKGRGKGNPNKITKTIRTAVETVFNEMQEDETKKYSLKKWAQENPKDFYLIAAKLIPSQIDLKGEIKIGLDTEVYE